MYTEFILLENIESDSIGFLATKTTSKQRSTKNKRKTRVSSAYVFNESIVETLSYQKYFTPDSIEEKQMLGLIGPVSLCGLDGLIFFAHPP